jgi:hypothetical protein
MYIVKFLGLLLLVRIPFTKKIGKLENIFSPEISYRVAEIYEADPRVKNSSTVLLLAQCLFLHKIE